jgi:hypothetical protein
VAENLRDPAFSSVLGLLQYGISSSADLNAPRRAKASTSWVKKLFATA